MSSKTAHTPEPPCVKWTPDCQGKWDYDGRLISISCRYWPRGGGFHVMQDGEFKSTAETNPEIRPSAVASITLNHGEPDKYGFGNYRTLREAKFEANTEAEVKASVEKWVAEQFAYIVRACNSHEALREALRQIVDECHAVSVPGLGAIAAAERALALAEEQK